MHCLLSEQAYILCRSRRDGGMIFLGEGGWRFIPHLGSAALDRRPSSLCLLYCDMAVPCCAARGVQLWSGGTVHKVLVKS